MKYTTKRMLGLALSCTMLFGTMILPAQAESDSPLLNLADRASRVASAVQSELSVTDEIINSALQINEKAEEPVQQPATVQPRDGIVYGGTINVRSGPGTDYERIAQVYSGKNVAILGEANGWTHVSFGSTAGYICSDYVREKTASDSIGEEIVALAMSFLGTRYVSGGASPRGFDCSGLTLYLYAQFGYSLPHSATSQYRNFGTAVSKSELRPGDLVFFSDSSHAIGHVAVYIGGGQIIHARYSTGRVGIDSLSTSYYTSHYVGAKRIF